MRPDDPNTPQLNRGDGPPPYPGYGVKHDLFYDPPQRQAPPPQPQGVPYGQPGQLGTSWPAAYQPEFDDQSLEEQLSPGYDEELEGSSLKKILVIAGVIMTVVVIAVVFFLVLSRGGGNKTGRQQPGGTAQKTDSAGSDKVSTLCYSFDLPKPHDPVSQENTCQGVYFSGDARKAGIAVTAFDSPYSSLAQLTEAWKTGSPDAKIVLETDFLFGQYQAKKFLWTSPETVGTPYLSILVYVNEAQALISGGGRYMIQNSAISSFEIDGRYDSQFQSQFIFDKILASWQWK